MTAGRNFFILASLLMGLVVGLGVSSALNWPKRAPIISEEERGQIKSFLTNEPSLTETFKAVAKLVKPSVVGVAVQRTVDFGSADMMEEMRKRLPDLPEDFESRHPPLPKQEPWQQLSSGSGLIVAVEGDTAFILTNSHVVQQPDRITVSLLDDREFSAKLLAGDPKTDLALLSITGDDFHVADMGDSDKLEIGEWVIAIGNPFELSHTVTAGIVSAKGRSKVSIIEGPYAYEQYIQTDAAINPGNSGGPLVNLKGEVIGINTAIATRTGGYQGVGFAIPINLARKVMRYLREAKEVSRGFLGVGIDQLRSEQIRVLGLDRKSGVIVNRVFPESPAAKAGVQEGDVILSLNNEDIFTVEDLRFKVADMPVGSEVELLIFREKEEITLKTQVAQQPSEISVAGLAPRDKGNELGLKVKELTPEEASERGYEEQQGVLVQEVVQRSRASEAGIRRGELIQWVRQGAGRQFRIRSLKDYEAALKQLNLNESVGVSLRMGSEVRLIVIK